MGGLLDVFTGTFKASTKVANVIICPLDPDGNFDNDLGGAKILQFWPESLAISKSPNWQSKEIPGSPIPIYQWMSGGERQFSFSAIFSRDMDGEMGVDLKEDKYNVDIDAAMAWLSLLSSSDYETAGDMQAAVPPPILWMSFMGQVIDYNYAAVSEGAKYSANGVHCVMTGMDFEIRNWFPSGRPRLASANLTFAEVIQIGKGIYPYGRDAMKVMAKMYTRTPPK